MMRTPILVALAFLVTSCGNKAQNGPGNNPADTKDTAAAVSGSGVVSGEVTVEKGSPADRKYFDVESGTIEMVSQDSTLTQTLYFDMYGARQAVYSTIKGESQGRHGVQITGGGWIYSFDPDAKGGIKMRIPDLNAATPSDPTRLSDDQKKMYNYQELEPRTVLGKETKGYSLIVQGRSMKIWLWNRISLRVETMTIATNQQFVMEATNIDVDTKVPASKFTIPTGVTLIEKNAVRPSPTIPHPQPSTPPSGGGPGIIPVPAPAPTPAPPIAPSGEE